MKMKVKLPKQRLPLQVINGLRWYHIIYANILLRLRGQVTIEHKGKTRIY